MADVNVDIRAFCDWAASGEDESLLEQRIAELAERFAQLPDAAFAQAGAMGALLRIELVRRKCDLSAYIDALSRLTAEPVTSDVASTPLAALVLNNGREYGMREWGRGQIENALMVLEPLTRGWPDDLDTTAARLFVLVMNRIEDPRARATIEALSDAAWRHRRIALLATFYHTRKSRFSEWLAAASRWAMADIGAIDGLERVAHQVSVTIAFRQLLGPEAAGPDGRGAPRWMMEHRPLKALARELLLLSRDLREFQDHIFHLVLANELHLPEPLEFFAVVLQELSVEDIAPEFLGQILAFFLANNMLVRATPLIKRVQRDEGLLASSHLAKFICLYAQLAADRDLESAVLAKVLRDDPRPEEERGNARLQTRELRGRAAAVAIERFTVADRAALSGARTQLTRDFPAPRLPVSIASGGRPRRIAIGLFGQMRDPDFTLPQVKKYFVEDIAANGLAAGAEYRFLLATWNRQAQKRLEPGYPIGEFTGLLPPEIGHIADGLHMRTSGDFAYAFPALFEELRRRGLQAQNEIGTAWIKATQALFGSGTLVEVADETPVDHDIAGFCEVDATLRVNSSLRNQFKMYHRIAGIGRLVEAWEKEDGAPIDIVVLARPDMLFESGSVMRHVSRLLASGTDNTMICDWNAGAMLNEGLGDNIIIGTRRAMATLFDGYSRLSAIFSPDAGDLATYRPRIWGHRFLGTSVFIDGIDLKLIPREEIRWRLHRGRLDLAALRGAASGDAEASPIEVVRRSLAAVLTGA